MNKSGVFVLAAISVVFLLVSAFAASPFVCAVAAFAAMIFAALTAVCYCVLPNYRDPEIMLRILEDNDPQFCPLDDDGNLLFTTYDLLEKYFLNPWKPSKENLYDWNT